MNQIERDALKNAIEPIATEIRGLFMDAMTLRVEVHISLALSNGCEDEDIPEIIANAIETATPLTLKFFDAIGEVKKAHAFKKPEKG